MNWVQYPVVFLALLGSQILTLSAKDGLRLAVIPLEKNPALSDRVLVELSQIDSVEVVERTELSRLIGEGGLKALTAENKDGGGIGHLLGVDVLMRLRAEDGQFWVSAVDARSGAILASEKFAEKDLTKEKLGGLLEKINLEGLEKTKGLRVAVDIDAQKDKALELRTSEELQRYLIDAGFTVVDRLVVGHVAAEHVLAESGMVSATDGKLRPMLGADLILRGEVSGDQPPSVKLSLLDLAHGKLKAQSQFGFKGKNLESGAYEWLAKQLQIREEIQPRGFPISQIEAIEPFYKGIQLYYDGDYLSAIESFAAALVLDDRFDEAVLWEARCYDAMGLGLLGDATRRYRDDVMPGRGISSSVKSPVVDGVTFLGVQGSDTLLCRALELRAIDVLGGVVKGKLQLTGQLELFRNEYDALTGAKNKEGVLWTNAPGFFTRWSINGVLQVDHTVHWTLLDSLEGKVSATLVTGEKPDLLSAQKQDFARFLRPASESQNIEIKKLKVEDFSVEQLRKDLNSNSDKAMNRAFLILMILDPSDPALRGRWLHRGGNNRAGFEGFLNFACREYIIAHLPADDPWRQWLMLKQMGIFLPYEPSGLLFAGKKRDSVEDLGKFLKGHPDAAHDAVARYMLLWETMSGMSPGEIEQTCDKILQDLDTVKNEPLHENAEDIRGMTLHLRELARYAGGKTSSDTALPTGIYPYREQPEPTPWGKIYSKRTSIWRCNEWEYVNVPPELRKQEAQAALLVLGRPDNQYSFDEKWIETCPDSLILMSYAIETLHETDHPFGRPFRHPFDMDAERSAYLKRVDFCNRTLLAWMKRADNPAASEFLEDQSRKMVMYLTRYAFADSLSDEKFAEIQQGLAAGVDEMAQRIGTRIANRDDYWRRMPRRLSTGDYYVWFSNPKFIFDPAKELAKEQALGKKSWAISPAQDRDWWTYLHSEHFDGFFHRRKVGDIVAGYEGDMQRIFSKGDLGMKEAGFVLDYALNLFYARRYAQAEPWFRKLAEMPESDLNRFDAAREYILNGKMYLALILVRLGRENEALDWLKQCQRLDMKKTPRLIRRVYADGHLDYSDGEDESNLETNALRLISDIRIHQGKNSLPKNIIALNIPLKDGNGAALPCYARIPAGYDPGRKELYRILILAPSLDLRGLNGCLDASPWARYADDHGLILLSPDFSLLFEVKEYWYHFPQDWSGDAVLQAVAELQKNYHADPDHLFLHGYGGGGQFVQRFARFVPDRCAAVSAHSTNGAAWLDGAPGLRPLSDLKNVDFLVTCGEFDDRRLDAYERNALGVQFVTAAMGAGVPVIWKSWPGMGQRPGPQVDEMAQEFFTAELNKKPGDPGWVGDVRTGKYVKGEDIRSAKIPSKFKVRLATEKLARAFGEPLASE